MSIFNIFRSNQKKGSASVARERLQIIVAHERIKRSGPDYLPDLQREIMEVIAKYVKINKEQVNVKFQNAGDCSVLELNVTLPEAEEAFG